MASFRLLIQRFLISAYLCLAYASDSRCGQNTSEQKYRRRQNANLASIHSASRKMTHCSKEYRRSHWSWRVMGMRSSHTMGCKSLVRRITRPSPRVATSTWSACSSIRKSPTLHTAAVSMRISHSRSAGSSIASRHIASRRKK